jgi:5-hydroxyisourate hydrolase-like protein (transthyretin family)
MPISTRILDATTGRPAAGVRVTLDQRVDGAWRCAAVETTGPDGGAIKSEVELTASVDFTARILGATDDQLSAVLSEALGGGESGEAPKKQKRPK